MKKTFAYAVLAAILGIAVMLAPIMPSLITSTSSSTLTGGADTPERSLSPQSFSKQSESSVGIVPNFSADAFAAILMLLLSLAIAFSVFFYVRRTHFVKSEKMPLPT